MSDILEFSRALERYRQAVRELDTQINELESKNNSRGFSCAEAFAALAAHELAAQVTVADDWGDGWTPIDAYRAAVRDCQTILRLLPSQMDDALVSRGIDPLIDPCPYCGVTMLRGECPNDPFVRVRYDPPGMRPQ